MTVRLTSEELEWFNANYATIEINGGYYVIRLDDAALYNSQSFHDRYLHKSRQGVPLASLWLRHARRRHYARGITFDPSQSPSAMNSSVSEQFNLWRGLAKQPQPGDVSRFLDFVEHVICGGDKQLSDYVIAWLANLFQAPNDRPGTALVLRGEQGVGKSVFASFVAKLLGRHFLEVSDPEHIIGRFSGHLDNKLLISADESAFTTKRAASKLKNMITSDSLLIEPKGKPPYQVPNFSRFIFCGNHERLIHADADERRYCVIDVGSARKNDHAYFRQLASWRDSGGDAQVLHFLLTYRGQVNLRAVPQTKALIDHKLNSLDDFDRWYLDCLQRGYFLTGHAWTSLHRTEDLHYEFSEATRRPFNRSTMTQFGAWLLNRVPGITKGRPSIDGKQTWCYSFPSLSVCRTEFERRIGSQIQWFVEPLRLIDDKGPATAELEANPRTKGASK